MKAIPFLALLVAVLMTGCSSSEQSILLSDVPQVILDAALEAVPGLEIQEVSLDTEKGIVVYEVEGITASSEFEIEVAEDGRILEIEEEQLDD